MATVYPSVNGVRLEKLIANCKDAQAGLDKEANAAGVKASAILSDHEYAGDSRILVEKGLDLEFGHIDRFVILDDTRGLSAAMSIEFGRKPNAQGKGGMKGVAPLRKSVGIEVAE